MPDVVDLMVAGARRQLVEAPVVGSAASFERAWERAHRAGRADVHGDRLVLWNFAVNDATLKSEHRAALDGWLTGLLRERVKRGRLEVVGRASSSGTEVSNAALGAARAAAVRMALTVRYALPVSRLDVQGAGSSASRGNPGDGEAMARDRAVELVLHHTPERRPEAPYVPQMAPPLEPEDWGESFSATAEVLRWATPWPPYGYFETVVSYTLVKFAAGPKGVVVEHDVVKRGLKVIVEDALIEGLKVAVGTGGVSGSFGVGRDYYRWTVAVEIDAKSGVPVWFSASPAATVKVPLPGDGEVTLGQVKAKVRFVPHPETIVRVLRAGRLLARALAPWAAAPALVLSWTAWGLYALTSDALAGKNHAAAYRAREGYAMCLACHITGADPSVFADEMEETGSAVAGSRRLGWEIADAGWRQTSPAEREQLRQAAARIRPTNAIRLKPVLWDAVGRTRRPSPLPHPREVAALLPR